MKNKNEEITLIFGVEHGSGKSKILDVYRSDNINYAVSNESYELIPEHAILNYCDEIVTEYFSILLSGECYPTEIALQNLSDYFEEQKKG